MRRVGLHQAITAMQRIRDRVVSHVRAGVLITSESWSGSARSRHHIGLSATSHECLEHKGALEFVVMVKGQMETGTYSTDTFSIFKTKYIIHRYHFFCSKDCSSWLGLLLFRATCQYFAMEITSFSRSSILNAGRSMCSTFP